MREKGRKLRRDYTDTDKKQPVEERQRLLWVQIKYDIVEAEFPEF